MATPSVSATGPTIESLARAMALAGDDTVLALCSALSQQPMRDYEDRGGKSMFIPKDYGALLRHLGAPIGRMEPLMAEEFWLHYPTESEAKEAFEKISAARTNKRCDRAQDTKPGRALVHRRLQPVRQRSE